MSPARRVRRHQHLEIGFPPRPRRDPGHEVGADRRHHGGDAQPRGEAARRGDVPAAEVGEREHSPAVLLDRRVGVLEAVGAEVAMHRGGRHPVLPDEVHRCARVVAERRERRRRAPRSSSVGSSTW